MLSAEEFLSALDPLERGRLISVLRSARGMTRDELAKAAQVSANTVTEWEHGRVRSPRNLFAQLNGVLNLSLISLQQALALVHAQSGEQSPTGHADPGEEIGFLLDLDTREMTSREIESEIVRLYSEIGRHETRIHLLHMELAVRHGVLRSRG